MSGTYECYLPFQIDGHGFIRELEVSLEVHHNRDPTCAYQWLDQLLGHLPPNKLLYFRYVSRLAVSYMPLISIRSNFNRPLPAFVLKKLWLGQESLKNIEIFPSWTIDTFCPRNIADYYLTIKDLLECADLKELESIRVIPDCSETAALCSAVLQRGQPESEPISAGLTANSTSDTVGQKVKAKVITTLEIDGCQWCESPGQGMTEEDQLVESIFAHVPRAHPGQKGALDFLTTLLLKDVNLTKSRSTWHTFLSLGKLRRLQLHYCTGMDVFLMELTSDDSEIPVLTSLSIAHDPQDDADQAIEAIDTLLHYTGNEMQDLELCLRSMRNLPKTCGITQHRNSLRSLFLDIRSAPDSWNNPNRFLVYEESDLRAMLKPCTQLRELALGMQNYSFQYERITDAELDIAQYTQAIFESAALDTLNILNLPTEYDGPHHRPYADHALGRVANDIYKIQYESNTRALGILAFGGYSATDEAMRFFIPIEIAILRTTGWSAAPVPLAELRKEGLASKFLDHDAWDFDARRRKRFNPTKTRVEIPVDPGFGW